jgi:hypothetical protein
VQSEAEYADPVGAQDGLLWAPLRWLHVRHAARTNRLPCGSRPSPAMDAGGYRQLGLAMKLKLIHHTGADNRAIGYN